MKLSDAQAAGLKVFCETIALAITSAALEMSTEALVAL